MFYPRSTACFGPSGPQTPTPGAASRLPGSSQARPPSPPRGAQRNSSTFSSLAPLPGSRRPPPPHLHAQEVLGQLRLHLRGHGGRRCPQAALDPRARVALGPRTPAAERAGAAERVGAGGSGGAAPPCASGARLPEPAAGRSLPLPLPAALSSGGACEAPSCALRVENSLLNRGFPAQRCGARGCEQQISLARNEMVH